MPARYQSQAPRPVLRFVTSSPRETGQEIDLRPEASRLEDHAMSDIRLWLKNHPTSTNGLEAHYAREHSSTFR